MYDVDPFILRSTWRHPHAHTHTHTHTNRVETILRRSRGREKKYVTFATSNVIDRKFDDQFNRPRNLISLNSLAILVGERYTCNKHFVHIILLGVRKDHKE